MTGSSATGPLLLLLRVALAALAGCGGGRAQSGPLDGPAAPEVGSADEDVADAGAEVADVAQLDAGGEVPTAPDAGPDAPPATCPAEGECQHPLLAAPHVVDISGVTYNSNPPSSGPHCPVPTRPGSYPDPAQAPRCNWIHSLEHGAIVFLYKCPAGCPAVVQALQALAGRVGDADCPTRRVIIVPDALIETTVAAAAWGFTWRGNDLDEAAQTSLLSFADRHVGSRGLAPEALVCP